MRATNDHKTVNERFVCEREREYHRRPTVMTNELSAPKPNEGNLEKERAHILTHTRTHTILHVQLFSGRRCRSIDCTQPLPSECIRFVFISMPCVVCSNAIQTVRRAWRVALGFVIYIFLFHSSERVEDEWIWININEINKQRLIRRKVGSDSNLCIIMICEINGIYLHTGCMFVCASINSLIFLWCNSIWWLFLAHRNNKKKNPIFLHSPHICSVRRCHIILYL